MHRTPPLALAMLSGLLAFTSLAPAAAQQAADSTSIVAAAPPESTFPTPPNSGRSPGDTNRDSSSSSSAAYPAAPPVAARSAQAVDSQGQRSVHFLSTAAVGLSLGVDGLGAQIAVPLSQRTNLRAGGAFFSYNGHYTESGILVTGDVKFRTVTANLDWFPFGNAFHISPGFTFYNGNNFNASANVPGGKTFLLDKTTYTSSATDPIHGTGSLTFGKRQAPNLLVGFGNMIPRSGRHWSVPVEVGFQYIQDFHVNFSLAGTACVSAGCSNVATDATFQANLKAEQDKLNSDLRPLRFYPLVHLGVAYKF